MAPCLNKIQQIFPSHGSWAQDCPPTWRIRDARLPGSQSWKSVLGARGGAKMFLLLLSFTCKRHFFFLESHSVMSNSLRPHGLWSPWNSPGQNTRVGSLSLLQGIFPSQESNWGLLHCRWILYQLSYQGRPSKGLGEIHGLYSPWGCKESYTTE